VLRDAIGRDWQCGTLQVDFNLPGRLGAGYVAEDGQKHTPVMLHRAMFGSLERFIGILLEHHAGKLPTWLARFRPWSSELQFPERILPGSCGKPENQGLRVETDLRYEKVGFKIRSIHSSVCLTSWSPASGKWRRAPWPYAREVAEIWAVWSSRNSLPCSATKSRAAAVLFWRIAYRNVEARRRNEEISAPSVRVIAADGSQAGVMTRAEALQLASSQTLDLVEVSPMAEPPVVRVMDSANSCSNKTRRRTRRSESRSRFRSRK